MSSINGTSEALQLRDIHVTLGERPVLRGFNLSVAVGERVALAGPPGCGKTTVLRCILGFVVPDAGQVVVLGEEVNPRTIWTIRRRIAYVAQDVELGPGTVRQALERPFTFRANAHLRDNLGRAPELFRRFGLSDALMDQETTSLSGGQRQLVAIISALLLARPILLLDEPTANLDEPTAAAVAEYLASRQDLTIVAVTHHQREFDIGSRLVRLGDLGAEEQ